MPAVDRKPRSSRPKLKRKKPEKQEPKKHVEDSSAEMADMDLEQFMAKMVEEDEADDTVAAISSSEDDNIDDDSDSEPVAKSTKKQTDPSSGSTKYKRPAYLQKSASAKEHKAVLESLKQKDPDLFKFLENTDRDIFNFEESSDEEDVHQLPSKLATEEESVEENSSDEETQMAMESEKTDESGVPAGKGLITVTLTMVENWDTTLHKCLGVKTLSKVVSAFQAAVAQASGNRESTHKYLVEGRNEFNAIVRTCLRELPYALPRMLNTKPVTKTEAKHRNKIIYILKIYFAELSKLLAHLAESSIINTLLKHVNQMIKYIASSISTTRFFLKTLVDIWCQGEETSRVLAFLAVFKILQIRPIMVEKALKSMYMAFIRNTKFTSATLLPVINFMKHSMVEIFQLNSAIGYQYTFVYVRQLAIHLRNSMAVKKSEGHLMVYNWQFMHSLSFFSMLICSSKDDVNIGQLLFPLIEIIIGTVRCVPTARFYPLRFHCIRMLNTIAKHTGVYVPAVSMLLEVFEITDFHRKAKKSLTKPIDMSIVLKLTKEQLADRTLTEAIMDQFYELFLDGITVYSHTVGFPELCVPLLLPMKHFVKRAKIASLTRQLKQLVKKTQESIVYLKRKRDVIQLDIRDKNAVKAFEDQLKKDGTPLLVYYKHYRKLRDRETQLQISGKEKMDSYDRTPRLPTGQPKKATDKERSDFKDLFADWNSDEEEKDAATEADEDRFKMKNKGKKSEKTKTKKSSEDDDDDAASLGSEDYDLLNQSSDDAEDVDEEIETEENASDDVEDADSDEEDNEADEEVDVKEELGSEEEQMDSGDEVKEFSLKDF